jgi:hypothetical protein
MTTRILRLAWLALAVAAPSGMARRVDAFDGLSGSYETPVGS